MEQINTSKKTRDRANNPPNKDYCHICRDVFFKPDTVWFFCADCRQIGKTKLKTNKQQTVEEANKSFWDNIKGAHKERTIKQRGKNITK